ncbi:MAG TPA: glycoside hydrolase family 3 C-terminal domain-containing protein, partial [Solirubrobacteraceae bacterium]|nr:glycoside hydrolase family 3 C-terminal domain-containing protein [Solirubrobacteraceae bacterium]
VAVITAQGSLGDVPLPAVAQGFLGSPAGSGVTVSYYANANHAGEPLLTRVEPTIELADPPADLGHAWSARWTGQITPPATGLYRLSLLVAGGAALYLDGELVLAGEREAARFIDGPLLPLQAECELRAERPVRLRLDYTTAPAVFAPQLVLGWQTPGSSLIAAAADAAGAADVAIVFVNTAEGEGMDRSSLALPGDQDRLVRAVANRNPKTVVVVNSSGPVLMPWLDEVAAVLQVWYPGEQYGSALAAVLFGDADPGGRLPLTFPAGDDQGPAAQANPRRYPGVARTVAYEEETLVGHRWFEVTAQEPLFPFGHGLSYGAVELVDPRFEIDPAGSIVVSVELVNAAKRGAVEVVQVYRQLAPQAGGRAARELRAFSKVELPAASRRRVSLALARSALAVYRSAVGWEIPAGAHTIWLGRSSAQLELVGTVALARPEKLDGAPVH